MAVSNKDIEALWKRYSQADVVDCVVSAGPDDLQPTSKEESMPSPNASKESGEDAKIISYVYVGFNDGMKIEHHKLSYSELVSFIKRIQTLWNVRIIKIV